jgi:pimeloyl-ACP methyl ester carboxylesterase
MKKNDNADMKWNPQARVSKSMFEAGEHVSLQVTKFDTLSGSESMPIVMVTGLATLIESFRHVVDELTKDFPLFFFESREKSSSKLSGEAAFDIGSMGRDLAGYIESAGFKEGEYLLMGYSLGATVIMDGYRYLARKPRCLILLEPTPAFHYPVWSILLIRYFGVRFYTQLKSIAKWYLGRFHINKQEDNEMAVISSQSLDNADPRKLTSVILAIAGYEVWDQLGYIDCPALVVGTSKDGLHNMGEIMRLTSSLKYGSYKDLETNLRTHSRELGEVIRDYLVFLAV